MARVTVEDCVLKVPNRFELVLLAAQRARDIAAGRASSPLDRDNDKNPVVALREIADETIGARQPAERADHGHAEACRDRRARGGPGDRDRRPAMAGRSGAGCRQAEAEEGSLDEELDEDMLFVAEDDAVGLADDVNPDLAEGATPMPDAHQAIDSMPGGATLTGRAGPVCASAAAPARLALPRRA